VNDAALRAQFEAMMLEPLLQPISEAFGGYGEIAAQAFSAALARALT
jgi:hypothetical protein